MLFCMHVLVNVCRVNYTRSGGSLSAASHRTNVRKNELLYPATIKYNPLLVYSDTFDNFLSLLCGATKFIKNISGTCVGGQQ